MISDKIIISQYNGKKILDQLEEENVMVNKQMGIRWFAIIILVLLIAVIIVFPTIASTNSDKLVTMPSFGDIYNFEITADGQYVIFTADMDTDGDTEIYSIPMTGGTPEKLSLGPLIGTDFIISPDGNWVVYTHNDSLYSVPAGGPSSASVKISGDDVINSGGYAFISPDSQWVVYMVDEPGNYYFVTAMYSVPIAGGTRTKLNKDLVSGGSINYYNLVFSPDSQYVVYGADQDTAGMDELYSVPITGPASAGVKLNGALPNGGNVELWWEYAISPDGSRVLYRADQVTVGQKELYSVPVAGPAEQGVKLNGSLPDGAGGVNSFRISPDSSWVVYRADQDKTTIYELFSVPLVGGSSTKLNHDLERYVFPVDEDVHNFEISPDSSTVVFEASWQNYTPGPDQYIFLVYELYSVPITGSASDEIKLWGPVEGAGYPERNVPITVMHAANHPICDIKFNQQGDIAVYRSEWPSSDDCVLWSIPVDGSASPEQLYASDISEWPEVNDYEVSPDDARVVYSMEYTKTVGTDSSELIQVNGTLAETRLTELFSVAIEGPANESLKLNGELVAGGNVISWDLSPDGCHVVYKADQDSLDVNELYIADHPCTPPMPVDTPTPTTPPPGEPGDEIKLFLPLTIRN